MNLLLDNRTQNLMQVAVSIILCLVMLIAWLTQKTYPGFGRWTVSKVPHAIGFLLISLRGLIPDWISIVVANALLFVSPILLYEGICQFLEKPHRKLLHYILLGVLIGGFSYFLWVKPNLGPRILLLTGFSAFVIMRSVGLLFSRVPKALRPSYRFTATMFGVYSLVLMLRVLTAGTIPQQQDPFAIDLWQDLLLLATLVMPIAWTFGFFMMTNARLTLELQTAENELREMATTDYLTGILNRLAFIEMGQREMARARRKGHPMTVLLIDADHFKRINDLFGHQIGDALLCAITNACRAQLRTEDLLARWGGEEFAILLPNTDMFFAVQIAERLCDTMVTLTVPSEMGNAHATISIGCAEWSLDEEMDVVMHRADTALYHAKARGRNCAVAYRAELECVG